MIIRESVITDRN